MDCFTAARDVTQRTLSFDIHAIFTLVSAARVRNIAISINVLNFFSRPPRDLLLTFAIGFSQRTLTAPPLLTLATLSTPVRSSDDRYTSIRSDASIEFASSFLFSARSRVFSIIHYTNFIRHTVFVVSSDKRNRNFQWEFPSVLFRV